MENLYWTKGKYSITMFYVTLHALTMFFVLLGAGQN